MNILIITTHFKKLKPSNQTLADYYFAKEWIKTGNVVKVLHLEPILFVNYKTNIDNITRYSFNGIAVCNIQYLRLIPKSNYTDLITRQIVSKKCSDFVKTFKPDLVFADFCAGNWYIVRELVRMGTIEMSKVLPVFNNCDFYEARLSRKIINQSHIVCVRSNIQLEKVLKVDPSKKTFIAYSGAPDCNNENAFVIPHNNGLYKILYVGDLIPLKNVDAVIKAVAMLHRKYNVNLTIIGDGPELGKLEKLVVEYEIEGIVCFLGRLERVNVIEHMKMNDIFIMISKPESFGIVYIEAMRLGCFTVGSIGEGIDGVIINNYNGALVNAGNFYELSSVISNYIELPTNEKRRMISNGIETGKKFNEQNVSAKILDDYYGYSNIDKYHVAK